MQRRSFIASILAAGTAPAFARSGVLMPIKKVWTPPASASNRLRLFTAGGMLVAEVDLDTRERRGAAVGTGAVARYDIVDSKGDWLVKGDAGNTPDAGIRFDNPNIVSGSMVEIRDVTVSSGLLMMSLINR